MKKQKSKVAFLNRLFNENFRQTLKAGSLACLIGASFMQCNNQNLPEADKDNGGLALPDGFDALVVVDSIGRGRHMAVRDNGDIYVKLRAVTPEGGNIALRDTNNDGRADIIQTFGDYQDPGNYGTAMSIYKDYIYYSTTGYVYRNKLTPGKLIPESERDTIVIDPYLERPYTTEHIAKPIAFDDQGHIYVPFGAPGDVCQEVNRKPGSPGKFPCPELELHGGVWRFDADKKNQLQTDGKHFATGIRSIVAMDWNPADKTLYALQHGRDNFSRVWPDLYDNYDSALQPSEEFFKVTEGMDGGWPYYYYDWIQEKKVLNPEYGGDGKKEGNAHEVSKPLIGFPGHWAPNGLFFYTGDQFPERYKNGAFIAFHGSTIRAPYPQAGYFVCFVPFENGVPSKNWEVFADGFAQVDTIVNTNDAAARPMGLAQGPDGSLYISDSVKGKIWRVMYKGNKKSFGQEQLAKMEARKQRTNIKTPDKVEDNLQKETLAAGASAYNLYCGTCHLPDGKGDGNRFPPIHGSEWVSGNKKKLIEVVLNGLSGNITVNGKPYNGVMPPHDFLKDEEIAQILTYIRLGFGNYAGIVTPDEVKKVREEK